jgi:hypothetical protein
MDFHLASFVYGLVAGAAGVGVWWYWIYHKAKVRAEIQSLQAKK